jgi:hypothetical protein
VFFTRANADVLNVNRTTSDGAIAHFRKNGTTVGSIGSGNSGLGMYISAPNSGGAGLFFNDNASVIYPTKNVSGTNTLTDDYVTLGASTLRFKDAYLSGGVYLGGTGAANKLNDYEEGTWTPRVEGYSGGDVGTTQTYSAQDGYYTKIGNMVYANFQVRLSSKGNIGGNYAILRGLPFNHAGSRAGSFIMNYFWSLNSTVSFVGAELGGGASTSVWLTKITGTGQTSSSYMDTNVLTNTTGFQGTFVYRVS